MSDLPDRALKFTYDPRNFNLLTRDENVAKKIVVTFTGNPRIKFDMFSPVSLVRCILKFAQPPLFTFHKNYLNEAVYTIRYDMQLKSRINFSSSVTARSSDWFYRRREIRNYTSAIVP